jgi:hypothetical protein
MRLKLYKRMVRQKVYGFLPSGFVVAIHGVDQAMTQYHPKHLVLFRFIK